MRRRVTALLLALAMVLSLAACGAGEKADAPAEPSAEEKSPAQKPSESRVFVDDAGREVEIPAEISRIVPSAPLPQIVLQTIAPEMIVGVADKFSDSAKGILPDELLEQPYFGSLYSVVDLNVEELAVTAPQIIIDMGEVKKSTKEDLDTLQSQTLIPSVFISATLETMPETYRKLGKLLGKEEKGEQLAQFCERVYARTVAIMERVGDKKVNCLYVLGEEGLNVIAANSYHAELLDMLTNNVAVVDNPLSKGTGNAVTMEQISVWNPDFVIFGPGSIYSTVEEITTWNQIKAIVNGDYVEVPDAPHNWMSMPPSVQRYLGLIWLTAELYPEYCDYDVKTEIVEFYKLFYGCELSDEQYESITKNAFRSK